MHKEHHVEALMHCFGPILEEITASHHHKLTRIASDGHFLMQYLEHLPIAAPSLQLIMATSQLFIVH